MPNDAFGCHVIYLENTIEYVICHICNKTDLNVVCCYF